MVKLYLILTILSFCIPLLMFHIYWLLGGDFGLIYTNYLKVKKNKKSKTLRRFKILFFLIILSAIVIFNLSQTGLLINYENQIFIFWANRIFAIILLYRSLGNFKHFGFTKTLKKGTFANLDTWVYSPIFFIIAICQYYISLID